MRGEDAEARQEEENQERDQDILQGQWRAHSAIGNPQEGTNSHANVIALEGPI